MGLFNKKELLRISELESELSSLKSYQDSLGITEVIQIKIKLEEIQNDHVVKLKSIENQIVGKTKDLDALKNEVDIITNTISEQKKELYDVEETLLNESFGIYKPKYDCTNSAEYKERIDFVRKNQKDKIKDKVALAFYDGWTLDGSAAKGRSMNNDNMKMVLRAFNNECDVLISKAKFNNMDIIEDRIRKSAKAIDKLNTRNKISILPTYINLKIEELQLVHEYLLKKQEEKEELRKQREDEREDKKLQEELKKARTSANKEFQHYLSAKEKMILQLEASEDKEEIKLRLSEIDEKLTEIEKGIEELDYRDANKRAGYVYVISNIGAFGENIYKIGMTRRLEPMDRVDELGDASVPFKFDVHALIFSDDAPTLESTLHNTFSDRRVNMVNGRKEFFNVSLDEIEKVIKENHDKLVEINKEFDAEQYRETLVLKKEKNKDTPLR